MDNMDKKIIVRELNSLTEAIAEQATIELACQEGGTNCKTQLIDTRDPETIIEATNELDVFIAGDGFYVVALVDNINKFAEGLRMVENKIKNREVTDESLDDSPEFEQPKNNHLEVI